MGDTGAGFGSFGGGFAKGLANVLYKNQQEAREDARRKQEAGDRLKMAIMPTLFENVDNLSAAEPVLQQWFPETFGKVGSVQKSKDGKPSAFGSVQNVFKSMGSHFAKKFGGGQPPGNDLPSQGGISGTLGQAVPSMPSGAGEHNSADATGSAGEVTTPISPLAAGVASAQVPAAPVVASPLAVMPDLANAFAPPTALPKIQPQATLVPPGPGMQSALSGAMPGRTQPRQSTPLFQPPSISGGAPGMAGTPEQTPVQPLDPGAHATVAPPTPPEPPAARKTFMGVPLMTPEEKADRDALADTAKYTSRIRAAHKLAEAMVKEGTASNITEALDKAADYYGLFTTPNSRSGSGAYQSVPGMMDGKRAFGVFSRLDGKYHDPVTNAVLTNFVPADTAASTSLGADREAKAREMFGKRAADLTSAEMAQVNAALPVFAGQMAEGRGLGTGRAKIATEMNSPIGVTAAQIFNVPPTTLLRELSQTNALRPEQHEMILALGQLDTMVVDIDALIPEVFPKVEEGVRGYFKTQLSLGLQAFGGSEDLAKLDAAIDGSLAQIAKLSGQPGSRLSDTDLRLAKSLLATLTPTLFGGDTILTAKARVSVVKDLLAKAKGAVPSTGAPPPRAGAGGAAAPAAGGGARKLVKDATGAWVYEPVTPEPAAP